MSTKTSHRVTALHLTHFGAIIHLFARHEILIQEIIATVSGADATSIKLLTNDLDFGGKCAALCNLLHHRELPIDRMDRLREFLAIPQNCSRLRNDIAHSDWIECSPQEAIMPTWLGTGPLAALKPMHNIEHAKRFAELYDDQVAYSIDDLKDVVARLEANCARFREYAVEIDLVTSDAA